MSHETQILTTAGVRSSGEQSPHPIPSTPRSPRTLEYRERGLSIRPATMDDLPFIDSLQKMHTHMVGWMPGKQIEGKIAAGHVLVAEANSGQCSVVSGQNGPQLTTDHRQPTTPLGYCISQDQYSGRDDVGVIYQL